MPTDHVDVDGFRRLLTAVDTLFPDLAFLGSEGVLAVELADPVETHGLRIEVPLQPLELQSIGMITDDGQEITTFRGRATTSSHATVDSDDLDIRRLLDFDQPGGTAVSTDASDLSWLELRFDEPVTLSEIRLRNVPGRAAARLRGVRVLSMSVHGAEVLYDGARRLDLMRRTLEEANSVAETPLPPTLVEMACHAAAAEYAAALESFRSSQFARPTARAVRSVMNDVLLPQREIEWTSHGPSRSFRFWSRDEKTDYVRLAAQVAADLCSMTPNATFGFGSALAVERDGDLIPHDDDIDIIVGFEPHEAQTLAAANEKVEQFLRARGYHVTGDFIAHRKVSRAGGKPVDVFVGLREGDNLSSFPAPRAGVAWECVFPPKTVDFMGVPVPVPNTPHQYLESVYGPEWQTPNPDFIHKWRKSRRDYGALKPGDPAPE